MEKEDSKSQQMKMDIVAADNSAAISSAKKSSNKSKRKKKNVAKKTTIAKNEENEKYLSLVDLQNETVSEGQTVEQNVQTDQDQASQDLKTNQEQRVLTQPTIEEEQISEVVASDGQIKSKEIKEEKVSTKRKLNKKTRRSNQNNKQNKKYEKEEIVSELFGKPTIAGETIINTEIVQEKLEEAEETQQPKKRKKNILVNTLMLALNIFIMIFIINGFLKSTQDADFATVSATQGKRLWWLILAFAFYVIVILANTLSYYMLIKKTTGKKKFYLGYRISIIGKYYDNITPFAVGGQPFQIVTMSKAGINPGTATSIPIIRLIVNNMVLSVIGIVTFIFGIPNLPVATPLNSFLQVLVKICGVIGLIICAGLGFSMLFLGNRRIVGKSFSKWIVRLGYKMRIVKDYRKAYEKFNNQVIEYQNSTSYLWKNKMVLFKTILLCLLENIAYISIPFAIVMAFSNITFTCVAEFFAIWGICFVLSLICQMATAGIPLPGGTGMMELSFILFFGTSSLIGGTNIVWGLLFYRVFSYYIIIIHGFIQTIIDSSVEYAKNKPISDTESQTEQ